MTSKSTKIGVATTIGYLVVLAVASIECAEKANKDNGPANAAAAATAGAATGGLNFAQFADMTSMLKTFTDGQLAMKDLMDNISGTKVNEGKDPADKRESGKTSGGILNMNNPIEFLELMMNPAKFMESIAKTFNLDKGKFNTAVARGMNFGMETVLQPPLVCIKIIEKVFVPDACKLKFVCDIAKQLAMFKGQMPKLPDSYFEGAATAKAMYDGATGRECEYVYACEQGDGPKLKKEFAGLKQKLGGGGGEQGGESGEYAASQQSKVTARMGRAARYSAERF